ncbi:methyltransferase [Actinomadura geliboluensis]|uniref:Methyltransferase n=1 Tax=Actinomadura geliboluensis TaxID=882440 RepID=A0A5S4G5D4_9ACTN|nr:methyltransferase [Actinomadura geliboluensis]TMR27724.1 methyltransferase [Actinomadura geliboluensis]CNF13685.1 O-methyltransferase [Mycobacterium tuberculosis]
MTANIALHQQIVGLSDLITPMAIRATVTLGIADHIGEDGETLPDLAERVGAQPRPLGKLLAHLVSVNIVALDEGRYRLTELGTVLRRDGNAPWPFEQLDLDGAIGQTELAVIHLVHTLRTGESVYRRMFGTDLWSYVDGRKNAEDELSSQSKAAPAFDVEVLVEHPCWRTADTLVDVGGHTGALVEALLTRHPNLRATLLDLPTFARVARRRFDETGLGDRAAAVGQDFFEPLPRYADIYLLSAVLADWDDQSAVRLLRNCANAAGRNGRILLSEVYLPEHLQWPSSAMTLWLEAITANPDRTPEDLSALAAEAGLSVARVDRAATRVVLELHA